MMVSVTLGGRTSSWHPEDAFALESFLCGDTASRRLIVVNMATAHEDTIRDWTRRLIASHIGDEPPRLVEIDATTQPLCSAAAAAFGRPAPLSMGDLCRELIEEAELTAPLVWVRCRDGLAVQRDVATWLERSRALEPALEAYVVISVDASFSTADAFDLRQAWPRPRQRQRIRSDEWTTYVHERVAWHTGGDLSHVDALGPAMEALSPDDDNNLGHILRADARRRWGLLDEALRTDLGASLRPLGAHPGLLAVGLAPGRGPNAPVGWLASELLVQFPRHPSRELLRAAEACRPLAMRVLGRVMDLEALVRDALLPQLTDQAPPADAVRQFHRFHDGSATLERELQPPETTRPVDPWQVAGLAAYTYALKLDGHGSPVGRLRRFRNALAHGSSLGWRGLQCFARIEQDVLRLVNRNATAGGRW